MQQQRPHLRTVAATHATGVVAATPRLTPPVWSRRLPTLDLFVRRSAVVAICASGAVAATSAFSASSRQSLESVGRAGTSDAGELDTGGALSMRIRLTAALLLLALAVPASAGAHAFLVSSTPASGVTLDRAPRTVTLRFTEPVSPALTRCRSSTGRERRVAEVDQRGPYSERASRRAPATRDRRLSHRLFDGLAGRSPRHPRGHRVRCRDRGSSGQGL